MMTRLRKFLRQHTRNGKYITAVEKGTQEQWERLKNLTQDDEMWAERARSLMLQNHVTPLVHDLFRS